MEEKKKKKKKKGMFSNFVDQLKAANAFKTPGMIAAEGKKKKRSGN